MTASHTEVTLNAALLDSGATFRAAGIHHYLRRTLHGLAQAIPDAPDRWALHVHTGQSAAPIPGLRSEPIRGRVSSPLRRIVWEQTELPAALWRHRPAVFHGMVNVIPLLCPCPAVVTVMDLSFLRVPGTVPWFRRHYLNLLCGRSVHRADRVVAISAATADDLMHLYQVPASKLEVIHVPVNPTLSPQAQATDAEVCGELDLSAPFLLHVGTLEPRKNLGWLLRVFADWRRRHGEGWNLVLAGAAGWQGEDQRLRELVAELRLETWVRFTGYVAPRQLGALYRQAAACVFPSHHEGFGMPVLEALACGTPVLCSDIPSFREVAGDCGHYFSLRDPARLAALLRSLARRPTDWRRQGLAGVGRAARFSEVEVGKALLEVYRSVL